jgi:hypothetical protein
VRLKNDMPSGRRNPTVQEPEVSAGFARAYGDVVVVELVVVPPVVFGATIVVVLVAFGPIT